MSKFQDDLQTGRKGEQTVFNTLTALGLDIQDVANDPEYYYKGDFIINTPLGAVYLDAKVDNVMCKTKNIFCEEEVYFTNNGETRIGDMKKEYDYMAFVSYQENLIYFYDARILRQIYKKGMSKEFHYPESISYGRLLNMSVARKYGALMGKVEILGA